VSILSPDQAGSGLLSAGSVSAGSGPFASTASASAEASPGLLRGFASGEMLGGSIPEAQAVARSDAWFAAGEPWSGRRRRGRDACHAALCHRRRWHLRRRRHIHRAQRSQCRSRRHPGELVRIRIQGGDRPIPADRFVTTDVAALVGDSFEMLMKLHVSAGAVNSAQPGNAMSLADVRNTGHLYVDALSSDAEFIGSDGHRCTAPDARDSGARAIRARVHGDRPGLLRHAGKAAPRDHLG